jgi:hypothetical protein
MTRPLALVLALLLAGCAASPRMSSPRPAAEAPDANPEVHRGLQTNQKSSPDSGQSPGGDGLGGGRGL